jgi:hypothetical protein
MQGTVPNPMRPGRGTLPGTQPNPQRPTRSTMPGDSHYVEETEVVFLLPNPPAALKTLGDFVAARGGKVVKQAADEVRVMLAIDLYGSGWAARSLTSASGSGQLILTELEMRADPMGPHQIRASVRPLGALTSSITAKWRARCEQMQADLAAALTPAPPAG